MSGIDARTGQVLSEIEHVKQSIRDVLTTPVGARVMRRDYGSRLHEMIDRPITSSTIMMIYAATVEAILRWEPRVEVERIAMAHARTGHVELAVEFAFAGRQASADVALGRDA